MRQFAHATTRASLNIELLEDDVQIIGKTLRIYWVEVSVKYNASRDNVDKEVLQTSAKVESRDLALKMYDRMKEGYGI